MAESSRAHRALVERVAEGAVLKHSPRLQELLRYLCECAIEAPDLPVKEQQIGIAVFGRSPGYDTNQDTIVRVNISKLRKQLQQHFLSEGSHEPVIVDIPKGSYTPLFLPREEVYEEHAAAAPQNTTPWRWIVFVLAGVLAVSLLLSAWLGWKLFRVAEPAAQLPASSSPYKDHLWAQWLVNGRHTYIVMSDAKALFFSNLMGRPVSLAEYRAQEYPFNLFNSYVRDPKSRPLLTRFMRTYLTTTQDGIVTAQLSQTATRLGVPFTVMHSRDLRLRPQITDNTVLLGHRKGNPWVEVFEDRMNFVFAWNAEKSRGLILNRNPQPGEKESYPSEEGGRTYGTVFYAPRPSGEGTVLVLAGSDMTGVEVGGRFLADEGSCRKLHEALGLTPTQTIPPFEILLLARRVANVPFEPELLAWRKLGK
ncbi:MAG: helix-turn-helix domain-containing protein [Acidobacteria bacterium]|nr:MAG: helix-turn-helix domain-containing protein [Acidobacteriota bacterium]